MILNTLTGSSLQTVKSKIRLFLISVYKVVEKGNDQELIQSNSTSFPRHHTGKEQTSRQYKAKSQVVGLFVSLSASVGRITV